MRVQLIVMDRARAHGQKHEHRSVWGQVTLERDSQRFLCLRHPDSRAIGATRFAQFVTLCKACVRVRRRWPLTSVFDVQGAGSGTSA